MERPRSARDLLKSPHLELLEPSGRGRAFARGGRSEGVSAGRQWKMPANNGDGCWKWRRGAAETGGRDRHPPPIIYTLSPELRSYLPTYGW